MKTLQQYIYENNFHKSEINEKLIINKDSDYTISYEEFKKICENEGLIFEVNERSKDFTSIYPKNEYGTLPYLADHRPHITVTFCDNGFYCTPKSTKCLYAWNVKNEEFTFPLKELDTGENRYITITPFNKKEETTIIKLTENNAIKIADFLKKVAKTQKI